MHNILSDHQKDVLESLPQSIRDSFVFSGGTAIAAYYLHHRLSEDLDFVALELGQPVQFNALKGLLSQRYNIYSANKLYDRCIYFLNVRSSTLKIEFAPLYFPRIKPTVRQGYILLESLEDLTAHKIMALADRFEIKDFVDLYFIHLKTGWDLQAMIEMARKRNQMPYEYTINVHRIAHYPEGIQSLNFFVPMNADEIISFFLDADQEIKSTLSSDFD